MARGKNKPQHVIVDNLIQRLVQSLSQPLVLHFKLPGNLFVLLYKHASTAQRIESAPLRRRHQPRSGLVGNAFLGPHLEGSNQSVLG